MLKHTFIRVYATKGSKIEDASQEARQIAETLHQMVFFIFNGVTQEVSESDAVYEIVDRYNTHS